MVLSRIVACLHLSKAMALADPSTSTRTTIALDLAMLVDSLWLLQHFKGQFDLNIRCAHDVPAIKF